MSKPRLPYPDEDPPESPLDGPLVPKERPMSDAEFDPIIDLLDRIGELNEEEDALLEDLTMTQEALIECLTQLDIETGDEAS